MKHSSMEKRDSEHLTKEALRDSNNDTIKTSYTHEEITIGES